MNTLLVVLLSLVTVLLILGLVMLYLSKHDIVICPITKASYTAAAGSTPASWSLTVTMPAKPTQTSAQVAKWLNKTVELKVGGKKVKSTITGAPSVPAGAGTGPVTGSVVITVDGTALPSTYVPAAADTAAVFLI